MMSDLSGYFLFNFSRSFTALEMFPSSILCSAEVRRLEIIFSGSVHPMIKNAKNANTNKVI